MKIDLSKIPMERVITISAAVIIIAVSVWYGVNRYETLLKEYETAKLDFASTTSSLMKRIGDLEGNLANSTSENQNLNSALEKEKGRSENLDIQLQNITGTVSTLQKRISIDSELLQKYSKVFFLSENYVPTALSDITSSGYVISMEKPTSIHTSVWPFLERMLKGAESNNTPVRIISGYRSFGEQSSLKSGYKVVYGSGANQFSADQGYSEHQLGTTVDLTTLALGVSYEEFGVTKAYAWLLEHAHEYGFTLSYPKGNAYYQFEPWHWRFVGVKLATRLFEDNQHFYDLDQRIIDQYLVTLFD